MNQPRQSITLYCREGRSDKVYQVQLEPKSSGFVVNFQFGRRGSTLQSGTKTPEPVSYAAALKTYNRLVNEKRGKGYSEGADGARYEPNGTAGQQTELLPQLLNEIDESAAARLIADDEWYMQEKKDGRRTLIEKTGGSIRAINRTGKGVSISEAIVQAVRTIGGDFILDGEATGDVYWAFDLLQLEGQDIRSDSVAQRFDELIVLLDSADRGPVRVIPYATTKFGKQNLFLQFKAERAEGVVFKYRRAPYVAGRPASGGHHLKLKFTATATCKVLKQNEGKRSVALAVLQDPGDGYVEVGSLTIPANAEIPARGALVEVRYLYAYVGGSLFQPVYLRERNDIEMPDSVTSLKFKHGEDE